MVERTAGSGQKGSLEEMMPRLEKLGRAAWMSAVVGLAVSPVLMAALLLLPYSWIQTVVGLDLPLKTLFGITIALAVYALGIRLVEFVLLDRSAVKAARKDRILAATNR